MSSNRPPVVVVDTTTLRSDLMLSTSAWMRTKLLAAKGRLHLWVPEVVVKEAVRHYERQVRQHLAKLMDARESLKRMTWAHDLSRPDREDWPGHVDTLAGDYPSGLQRRLRQAGAVILPLPQMPHEVMLDRALREIRPFKAKGDKDRSGPDGYRDMLIWASIAERSRAVLSASDTLIMVTNNSADFCDPQDPATLAFAMRDDLGDDPPSVLRLPRLEDLSEVLPSRPEDGPELDIQKALSSSGLARMKLITAINRNVHFRRDRVMTPAATWAWHDYHDDGELDLDEFQLPLASPRLRAFSVSFDTLQAEVYGTDTDWDPPMILARVTARGAVAVEGFIPVSEYNESLGFSARLVNQHVYQAEATVPAEVQFGARYNPDGTLNDVEFEKASPTQAPRDWIGFAAPVTRSSAERGSGGPAPAGGS